MDEDREIEIRTELRELLEDLGLKAGEINAVFGRINELVEIHDPRGVDAGKTRSTE